ncbi:accessory gene regulator AgrB [Enterococcus rivorum]|uniref:Putative AgrB-like protein n=1 Tax=Enterococcus rivorum TaxID=762845 RepID=A0A1E5KY20_9ENTE|nr:accessory gene regulator B family protein [Enterococcus rivorum]MBP2099619.1 accessory gene regulator B [Enterococcus rivorum]OEH82756.1 hypothetical protein BCR26_11995 [Enterococcus rivorum]
MTHNLTLYCLRKIRAQDYMSEEDYEKVCYFLEVVLINLFKSIQIYVLALLLGTLLETFVMNCAYVLLRSQAGGWHAKSSTICSIFGITIFIGIPLLLKMTHNTFSSWFVVILSIVVLISVWHYAPADTEKNPLVSISERKRKRRLAIFVTLAIIAFSFIVQTTMIQTLVIIGLLVETLMISPLFYKLMKRSYRNYEKYVEEK